MTFRQEQESTAGPDQYQTVYSRTPRNSYEEIFVALAKWKNRLGVDMRTWRTDRHGNTFPGSGIRVRIPDFLDVLAGMLAAAVDLHRQGAIDLNAIGVPCDEGTTQWTAEQLERIDLSLLTRHEQGEAIEAIAARMSMDRQRVQDGIERARHRREQERPSGATRRAATALRQPSAVVDSESPASPQEALRLHEQGLSYGEIGHAMGVDRSTALRWVRRARQTAEAPAHQTQHHATGATANATVDATGATVRSESLL
ncbi:MAG: helix-turn-helix domain-containing protein [Burkholderiales bacterium]|nr:helix-turn-helix domain-containing protein [Burkholderiales bacterium]